MPAELTSAGRSRQTSAGCQPSRLTPGEEGVPWQCRDALAARQNAVTLWGRSCEGRAPVRNTPGVKIEDKAVDTTFQDATTTTTSMAGRSVCSHTILTSPVDSWQPRPKWSQRRSEARQWRRCGRCRGGNTRRSCSCHHRITAQRATPHPQPGKIPTEARRRVALH